MKQFCGQSKNSYRSKVIQVANTPTTKTRFTLYSSLKSVYIDATKVNWTQWRSKALRGPDSTVTCRGRGEGVSCFGSKGYSWKPEVLRAGWCFGKGLLPGLGSGVSSPSGVPQPPRVLMLFVISDDLFCYWKLCVYCASVSFHFTHFWEAGLLFSCLKIFVAPLGAPRSSGAPVHWTAWTPGFYAIDRTGSSQFWTCSELVQCSLGSITAMWTGLWILVCSFREVYANKQIKRQKVSYNGTKQVKSN